MSKANNSDIVENLVLMLCKSLYALARVCYFGWRRIDFKDLNTLSFFLLINGIPLLVLFGTQPHSQAIIFVLPLMATLAVITLFACGFKSFSRHILFQKAIVRAGLKTALGEIPKIKAIVPIGGHRLKVVIDTYGVGINKFRTHQDSLTAGFRTKVEDITHGKDMGKVELILCERDLPSMVTFHGLYRRIKEPCSFIVGQSIKGTIVQQIQSLPHLLISGATGGGKSVFFRATMLSLLKSSPHIQLYLLDMKRGVEVKEFTDLPNVKTAKDEIEAMNTLEALVNEMNRRYEILERNGHKSIDPKRDKLDMIVVGIDEAAVLFNKGANDLAGECMGKLARLARAACIHLVVATQKPVKEAISTEILDNLPGRMTFKMISSAASNVALGGNFAQKLPAIKGRGVWTNGSEHKQVQAPFVDDEVIEAELEAISQQFKDGVRKNFNSLLEVYKNERLAKTAHHI